MDFFLGIDLGTTGLKTTLLDTSGKIVASEYVEYPILSPQIGYAEQNPESWWTGLVTCCRSLRTNYPQHMSNLLGVGICGQMHTQVYLDGRMKILRPSITWMDQRSSGIVSRIKQDPDAVELIFRETKNFTTTTYTALHMKWVHISSRCWLSWGSRSGPWRRRRDIVRSCCQTSAAPFLIL